MSEKTKPYALITGASKGIGKSIAHELGLFHCASTASSCQLKSACSAG